MYQAQLQTRQNTFWLSRRGQWSVDRTTAAEYPRRGDAYVAAVQTHCISRRWGDKVSVVPAPIAGSGGLYPDRRICTADTPWDESWPGPVLHPDAVEGEQRDGWPAGDIVRYRCPHCGLSWEMELPQ